MVISLIVVITRKKKVERRKEVDERFRHLFKKMDKRRKILYIAGISALIVGLCVIIGAILFSFFLTLIGLMLIVLGIVIVVIVGLKSVKEIENPK